MSVSGRHKRTYLTNDPGRILSQLEEGQVVRLQTSRWRYKTIAVILVLCVVSIAVTLLAVQGQLSRGLCLAIYSLVALLCLFIYK
jgi:hypothetical protein